ncbi:MAG TPA: acyl carrier protein [Solirubrobacterales bacterium]|nr:acyl carrier protein [Solirubrobacterales bacterium]
MRTEDVRARVRAQIAEHAAVPVERVESGMSLTADLPLDSLQLYELAASLEDEFGLGELDEEAVAGIETVGDVEDRVLERLPAGNLTGGG